MRNAFHGKTQPRSSSALASSHDLLLAPADAYDFQRAGSTESTEAVRAWKIPATTKAAVPWDSPARPEDRGVPVSPKKLPPTPPRDRIRYQDEGDDLLPPSAVQLPRLVRSGGGTFLRPSRHRGFESSVFRSTPLLLATASGSPLSREHEELYEIHRSLAFDYGEDDK